MSPDRSSDGDRAIRAAYARGLGAGDRPLDDGRVVVVPRPDQHWGYLVAGATFADVTLVSAAPEVLELARSVAPDVHGPGALLRTLSTIRDHERAAGRERTLHSPSIGWSLAEALPVREIPSGMEVQTLTAAELNDLVPGGTFENGAGPRDGSTGRSVRNLYGVALVDGTGTLAVAGVFDTYGLHEIGVDVVAERRGEGLGRVVVGGAIREILDRGGEPFYGCSPTNIVSQRTAWSTGFRPTMADTTIT